MAFEEYKATGAAVSNRKDPNYVAFSVVSASGKHELKKRYNVVVNIGPAVMEQCKWAVGDKIATFFGSGDDLGKMLLKKSDSSTAIALTRHRKPSPGKENEPVAGRMLRAIKPVPPIDKFVNAVLPVTNIKFQWDEAQQGLMLELPEGFFTA